MAGALLLQCMGIPTVATSWLGRTQLLKVRLHSPKFCLLSAFRRPEWPDIIALVGRMMIWDRVLCKIRTPHRQRYGTAAGARSYQGFRENLLTHPLIVPLQGRGTGGSLGAGKSHSWCCWIMG